MTQTRSQRCSCNEIFFCFFMLILTYYFRIFFRSTCRDTMDSWWIYMPYWRKPVHSGWQWDVKSVQAYAGIAKSGGICEPGRWNILMAWEISTSYFVLSESPVWEKYAELKVRPFATNKGYSNARRSTLKHDFARTQTSRFLRLIRQTSPGRFWQVPLRGEDRQRDLSSGVIICCVFLRREDDDVR